MEQIGRCSPLGLVPISSNGGKPDGQNEKTKYP